MTISDLSLFSFFVNSPHMKKLLIHRSRCLSFAFLFLSCLDLSAQLTDTALFGNLRWRMIGPHRGGRTVGGCGVPQQPNVFYIGVNNGGVWKTTDFGRTWAPVFDAEPTGSIGDVAVARHPVGGPRRDAVGP